MYTVAFHHQIFKHFPVLLIAKVILLVSVPSKSFLSVRGMKGLVSSGEYSNLVAREKDFQELMYRKKRVLISSYNFSSQN